MYQKPQESLPIRCSIEGKKSKKIQEIVANTPAEKIENGESPNTVPIPIPNHSICRYKIESLEIKL
ncbi:hypothetical protein AMR47_16580 [Leptospira interrogans]|nr:hypothetical protein AMR47_16580 [Leptospira interrogans]